MAYRIRKFSKATCLIIRQFYPARSVTSKVTGKTNPFIIKYGDSVAVDGVAYPTDSLTNITPQVLSKVGRNLHRVHNHPLFLIHKRIENFFYSHFVSRRGNPIFSIYDSISPVVTLEQNFDSLLIPENHISRSPADSYYINSEYMLRSHTSAHQRDLIRSGLNAFLVVGDVYRRDEIDSTHYPAFHQVEGVRLFTQTELFQKVRDPTNLSIFDPDLKRTPDKQAEHSMEAAKLLEHNLKTTLMNLTHHLFGQEIKSRWVETTFPFTHPSWELEVQHKGDWLEVLGCGIIQQKLLKSAGTDEQVGWAFGLGLERLAMKLYSIPDIRLFWSKDTGFLSQFDVADPETPITYKPVSKYPQCTNDISFWLPTSFNTKYSSNDFYEIVRNIGGDLIEQVNLIDSFYHPKKQQTSHCYRIIYRHMERTLLQEEVNTIHKQIEVEATKLLGVEIR